MLLKNTGRQLKLPIEWYEKQCGLVSFNMETIMREIDLKRIHGSSQSPFKRSDIMYIMKNQRQPIDSVDYSKNLCPIQIYEKIHMNSSYIMIIDPAEGLGQDNNAMTLLNPRTQKPAAEFRSPYISQPDMCKLMCKFLDDYCPRSMIVIESNKGRELINCFLETKYRYQLYYDDGKLGDKVIEKTDPYGQLKKESMQRRAFGLWTGSNRSQYYAILENIMEERKDLVLSEYLVKDICSLIRKPSGRVEAASGAHDDNIMSYLMGMFIYLHSPYEKLAEYGINRGASEDVTEYDEHGNITEEGSMRKLIDMMDDLPEDMQEMIRSAAVRMDPVKDAARINKEIYRARGENDEYSPETFMSGGDDVIISAAPPDDAYWKKVDDDVWASNFRGGDDDFSSSGDGFDIEDYFPD